MPRRSQTYAIRLAVEGGGQVKAELVSVGEQSLKRIETAGGRASGGLKGLGRQAELLRAGVRTLGVALAGLAGHGGAGEFIGEDYCFHNKTIGRFRATLDRLASGGKRLPLSPAPPGGRSSSSV
jgi:hypothetical protein